MKKKLISWVTLILIQLIQNPVFSADQIAIIGLTEKGSEVIHKTSFDLIQEKLIQSAQVKNQVATEALNGQKFSSGWQPKKFSLGLGIEGEAGIGPWNLGFAIKHRLVYKKEDK